MYLLFAIGEVAVGLSVIYLGLIWPILFLLAAMPISAVYLAYVVKRVANGGADKEQQTS
jgi:hypothetical protein